MADSLNQFFQSFLKGGVSRNPNSNPISEYRQYQSILADPTNKRFFTKPPYADIRTGKYDAIGNFQPSYYFSYRPPVYIEQTRGSGERLQQVGFKPLSLTPIHYSKLDNGQVIITPPTFNGVDNSTFEKRKFSINSFIESGDISHAAFKYYLDGYNVFNPTKNDSESSDGGTGINSWEKTTERIPFRLQQYSETPYDNEDPVYFGFEIVINTDSSPLFNGAIEDFLDEFGVNNSEIESRRSLINQFQNEIKRYFRFNTSPNIDSQSLIWSTNKTGETGWKPNGSYENRDYNKSSKSLPPRIYYVKKVAGLEKLTESNGPDTPAQFVDYLKDKLTLTFYEDVTLNIGTLASLYKSIHWSRLRGKNIIPENLLRFDCEIILFDLRNLVRLKNDPSKGVLEFLKDNLSRYRYKVYECQFWFSNLPHPNEVSMSVSPTVYDDYTLEISYKFSEMVFERYDPTTLYYKNLSNTGFANGMDFTVLFTGDTNGHEKLSGSIDYSATFSSSSDNYLGVPRSSLWPPDRLSEAKRNRKKIEYFKVFGVTQSTPLVTNKPKEDIYSATDRLLQNLKNAGLREAQRALNQRARLLNNSLDRIRNSFGVGRIPPPRNVYDIPNNGSSFFFDVKNSLRSFGGDILLETITSPVVIGQQGIRSGVQIQR